MAASLKVEKFDSEGLENSESPCFVPIAKDHQDLDVNFILVRMRQRNVILYFAGHVKFVKINVVYMTKLQVVIL